MNTKKVIYNLMLFMLIVILLPSCSTKKKSWVSRSYHNTTARYNGYFNGNESIKYGIKKIGDSFEDDYSAILPIFKIGDLKKAKSTHPYMDKAIQKGSVVIQKHSIKIRGNEYCKWIDDSYLLVGKAYFYKGEFDEAAKTFMFIVDEYKKTKASYTASLWLSRCFIEKTDYASAESILMELDNNRLFPDELRMDYEMINADLYLRQKNYPLSRESLLECVRKHKTGKHKARINYIVGQIYQDQENYKKAVYYYQEVLKSNPEYTMVFNTKMNLALCTEKDSRDSEKMRRQLVKMTKDDKNKEYLDQVFYTIAEMDLSSNDTLMAKENYLKSTVYSIANDPQKSLSFLSLAKIEFTQSNFVTAQQYYDSTIYFMPEDYRLYKSSMKQYVILTDLVNNLNTIKLQDSLVALALLPKAELNTIIKNIISEERVKENLEKEKDRQKQQNLFQGSRGNNRNEQFGNNTSGGKWYFYNPATLSFGLSEFRKKWGKRKLEDDWRRKNRKSTLSLESDSILSDKGGSTNNKDPQFYLDQIPSSLEDFTLAKEAIANACYQAAVIYKNDLLKINKSTEMFNKIINIVDVDSLFLAMTYYNLYLNNNLQKNKIKSNEAKSILINDFPNSVYTKILVDSSYLSQLSVLNNLEDKEFEVVYSSFKQNKINDVIESTKVLKDNEFRTKYMFLRALSLLKTGDTIAFTSTLKDVVSAKEQELSKYAQDLLNTVNNQELMNEANRRAIEKTPYKINDNSQHIIMFILPKEEVDISYLKTLISDYHRESYSTVTFEINAMLMGLDMHLLTVKFFDDKNNALNYYDNIPYSIEITNELKKSDHHILAISMGNFQEFYKNKDLSGYTKFFKQKYLNKN